MPTVVELMSFFEDGWSEKCSEMGIIQRKREIKTPEDLMFLNLCHLLNGCSLLDVSAAGKLLRIGDFSDVAYMKKFSQCAGWFEWICEQFAQNTVCGYEKPTYLEGYRPLAVDATNVTEKGRSGQQFRLHYSIDIFNMNAVSHALTGREVGETLRNYDFKKGDLAIGDRIYGTLNGIEHCENSGADYLLRLRANHFKLYDADGKEVDIAAEFQDLQAGACGDLAVFVHLPGGKRLPVRICAKRKSDEEYAHTLKKLKLSAINHKSKTKDSTKIFNEFFIVATSLPEKISAFDVLETYRYRWQIEIYFKRLKSIMDVGDLPKKRTDSSRAWLNGKIMVALMIEFFLSKLAFSPQGNPPQRVA